MRSSLCISLIFLGAGVLLCRPYTAHAQNGVMTVQKLTIQTHLTAYARVTPIALVHLNAEKGGIINGLDLFPGENIQEGSIVGHLTGPKIDGQLAELETALSGARAGLEVAGKRLGLLRQQLAARISTRSAVYAAQINLDAAKTRFEIARTRLKAAHAAVVLRAPANGTVLSIDAANGQAIQTGQSILTMVKAGSLWVVARWYGPDAAAVKIGMTGTFSPSDGTAEIPVTVRSIMGTVGLDGGRTIGLVATIPHPGWPNGDTGMVTLLGPSRQLVAVPTRALILDQGRWWVLVHNSRGNHRQEVFPGPSRGTQTLVVKGLEPGAQVVVENAYLEFHRDLSKHYEQPD